MAIRNSNLKSRKEGTNGGWSEWESLLRPINAIQACILATKTAHQEALLMGTCCTSIPEERKPKISKKMLLPPH